MFTSTAKYLLTLTDPARGEYRFSPSLIEEVTNLIKFLFVASDNLPAPTINVAEDNVIAIGWATDRYSLECAAIPIGDCNIKYEFICNDLTMTLTEFFCKLREVF